MPLLIVAGLAIASHDLPNLIQPGGDLYPASAAAAKLEGDVTAHLQIAVDGSSSGSRP